MSLYLNLPVYKTVYELTLAFTQTRARMPRDARYTVGQDATRALVEILTLIYRINASREKVPLIAEARRLAVQVQIYFRLMTDLRYISMREGALFAELSESAAKQLAAWQRGASAPAQSARAREADDFVKGRSIENGRPECAGPRFRAESQKVKSITEPAAETLAAGIGCGSACDKEATP